MCKVTNKEGESKNEDGTFNEQIQIKSESAWWALGRTLGQGLEKHNEEFKINTCRWEMFSKVRHIDIVEALEKDE